MKGDNRLVRLARLLVAGAIFVPFSTGGLAAAEDGNSGGSMVTNPVLLWPLNINIPYDIVHLIKEEAMATVILRIDEEGKVVEWVSLDLPHYRLVGALDRSLESARFKPAMIDGEPVALDMVARIPVGSVGYYGIFTMDPGTAVDLKLLHMIQLDGLHLTPGHALDEPPEMISEGRLVNYVDADGKRITGSIEVEFYIDQDGVPRLIRSDPGEDLSLREAAHATVNKFRFSPPRFHGRPTVVNVRMTVKF